MSKDDPFLEDSSVKTLSKPKRSTHLILWITALFLVIGIIVFLIAGTFAFLKVNGRPFHYFVLNLVQTFRKPSVRVWNHQQASFEEKEKKEFKFEEVVVNKKLNEATLAELSLIIDTKGKYKGENGNQDIKNL